MNRDIWLSLDIMLPILAAIAIFAIGQHGLNLYFAGHSRESIPWEAYAVDMVVIAGLATVLGLAVVVFDFRSGHRARPIMGICLTILLWPFIYFLLGMIAVGTV